MYNKYTHIYPYAHKHSPTHAHMHECIYTGMYIQKLTNTRALRDCLALQCEWTMWIDKPGGWFKVLYN